MSGAVLLVLAALGAAAVGSMLLWLAPRVFRRRPPSFREQLAAVAARPGRPVGPARGVSSLSPIEPEPPGAGTGEPQPEPGAPARGDRPVEER